MKKAANIVPLNRSKLEQSYGCVSFCFITIGLLLTIFAVFQKDSQIGKVWLAGPTTIVVGLVLCGKVIIDWKPAMMHSQPYSDYSINRVKDEIDVVNRESLLTHPLCIMNTNCIDTTRNLSNQNCYHHHSPMPDTVNKNDMLESSTDEQNSYSASPSVLPTVTFENDGKFSCMLNPLLSSCERNKVQLNPMEESLYGAIRTREATDDYSSGIVSGRFYQGETFVLNNRNHLI
ncbi:unnamed protein product [Thelazia callipaeda]|uniref:Pecanex-like protein n=1 Tax=Thelazia callipaeda TaxID=103827 RepID=A0A0N5DAA6_THECL|nr:unnamed protein product [Thelazia callipaeda]